MKGPLGLLALLILFASPLAARAASIDLSVAPGNGVTTVGVTAAGVRVYAAYYGTHILLRGIVRDDAGKAAPAGTHVRIGAQPRSRVTPTTLGTVVTDAAGRFELRTAPMRSLFYLAHVDAAPGAGIAAAADAKAVRLGIAPHLRLTSPRTQQGQPYRIVGVVEVPRARTAGKVCLFRKVAGGLKGLACSAIDRHRRFHFAVVHRRTGTYAYRIVFVPRDPLVYVRSTARLTVRVV